MNETKIMLYLTFVLTLIFLLIAGLPPLDTVQGVLHTALMGLLYCFVGQSILKDIFKINKKTDRLFYLFYLAVLLILFVVAMKVTDTFSLWFTFIAFVLIVLKIFLDYKEEKKEI